jgi:hypothetical protein
VGRNKFEARALHDWFAGNARDLPLRRRGDAYAIWVSEIMLQQTQVTTVLPYWERWMQSLPTLDSLATARLQKVYKLWEGLGWYRRARGWPASKSWLIIIRLVVDYTTMIRRHITQRLLQALADTPAVLVKGPRQTGKSTLVQSAEPMKPSRQ